jgi:pyrroline-5-carboxylate reductase
MKLDKKISFIGFGRMGGALAAGALAAKAVVARRVTAYDPEPAALARARKLKINRAASEGKAALAGDIVFICVKPQQMEATLSALSRLDAKERRARCFVSIAAGIPLARLERALGAGVAVLRVMPNTPALLRAGVSAVSRGSSAGPKHEKWIRAVLDAVGTTVAVPESMMDAVTAVSGSGPAYVFYLAEAMTSAAELLGLPSDLARALVRQTIFGGGAMLRERPEAAEELRRQVTSPGGTTAAAVAVFDDKDLKSLVEAAIVSAAVRSAELSRA